MSVATEGERRAEGNGDDVNEAGNASTNIDVMRKQRETTVAVALETGPVGRNKRRVAP